MALFGLGNKKSETNYSTTNTVTDKSANAAEGAIAASEGSSIVINDNSDQIALGALASNQNTALGALAANQNVALGSLAANQNVSTAALASNVAALNTAGSLAESSLSTNRDVSLASIKSAENLATFTANTIAGMGEVASRERVDVLNTTNTALQSNQGTVNKLAELAAGALERSQTPDSQVTKTLLYVVGAVALAVALLLFRKGK